MSRLLVPLVLVITLATGSAGAQTFKSDYYPLQIGHQWIYLASDKDRQGKAGPKRKVVVEVDREETYLRPKMDGGKMVTEPRTGYLLKSTSDGKITFDHLVIMEEGIHKVHVAGTQLTPPLLFFKLPLDAKAGEKWEVNSTSGNATVKGTYTSKLDNVKVPLFGDEARSAVLISFRDPQGVEVDSWFVPKIGMVMQRVKSKNHESLLELQSIKAK